jgi:SAM-dependent methyltransferase
MRRVDSELPNVDERTVRSFGEEWSRFDQADLDETELSRIFEQYFSLFPWDSLPKNAVGFDAGCGTGRWARFVAQRVGTLHCVDASAQALEVARRNLRSLGNFSFLQCSIDCLPFERSSMDFGYSLGVLHHVPDTRAALSKCVAALKKGAPFLVYVYYAMDGRPWWFRALWRVTDRARLFVANLPATLRDLVCDALALFVYWPLARVARVAESMGVDVSNFPLATYRARSFYTMRTDSRDRFGTPLERRFTAGEIVEMMEAAGLERVQLSESEPFWCAIGFKS